MICIQPNPLIFNRYLHCESKVVLTRSQRRRLFVKEVKKQSQQLQIKILYLSYPVRKKWKCLLQLTSKDRRNLQRVGKAAERVVDTVLPPLTNHWLTA